MLESNGAEGLATVLLGAAMVLGVVGIVLPVLPGSFIIILALVAWAVLLGGPVVWTAATIALVLAVSGWSASAVLTGRALQREQIPRGPILIALISAVVGMVLLPPLGLFLGFAAGLFGAEVVRRNYDWSAASAASIKALRAMGIGILVEFALAGTAVSVFVLGAAVHFLF